MTRAAHAGVSMVELLVATAIGLIVVAAAGSVVAANQVSTRRVQIEARLMQDLRGAAELVGRDLRRAGQWAAAASGVRLGDAIGTVNPHIEIAPANVAASAVALSFSTDSGVPDAVDDSERFGSRLRAGAIEIQLGARNWQALSDPQTLVVTGVQRRPARRRSRAVDVLRRTVRGRQPHLPATPADSRLCDQRSRTCRGRSRYHTLAAQQRPCPQRQRRRQLRGVTAMSKRSRQRGVAAVFVSVMLCFAMVLAVVVAHRNVLVEEQRSANELRAGASFAAAEADSSGRWRESTTSRESASTACPAPTPRHARFARGWCESTLPTAASSRCAGTTPARRPRCRPPACETPAAGVAAAPRAGARACRRRAPAWSRPHSSSSSRPRLAPTSFASSRQAAPAPAAAPISAPRAPTLDTKRHLASTQHGPCCRCCAHCRRRR